MKVLVITRYPSVFICSDKLNWHIDVTKNYINIIIVVILMQESSNDELEL